MAPLINRITLSTKMPAERICKPQRLDTLLIAAVDATAPITIKAVEVTFSMTGFVLLNRSDAFDCFRQIFAGSKDARDLMRVRVDPEKDAVRISTSGPRSWSIPCTWISREI